MPLGGGFAGQRQVFARSNFVLQHHEGPLPQKIASNKAMPSLEVRPARHRNPVMP
jgi:hypothetical protein